MKVIAETVVATFVDAVTLTHLERPARGEPEGLLVLLHGRGADEHDLFPLLDVLDPERRLLGVTPRGAARRCRRAARTGTRCYRLGYPGARRRSSPTYPQLVEWLDGLGFPRRADGARRVLAGRRDDVRARARRGPAAPGRADRALVVHADGARRSSSTWRSRCRRSRSGTGRYDEVIGVEWGRAGARPADARPAPTSSTASTPMGHSIDPAFLDEIARWLPL